MVPCRIAALLLLVIAGAPPSFAAVRAGNGAAGRSHTEERAGVRFTKLRDGVWMHTSYKTLPRWGPFPSNGLIVLQGKKGALLIDTAWTDAQTNTVLDWVRDELGRTVTVAVVTHAHQDKMGGVGALLARGVATYAHPLSNRLAPSRGLVPADHDLHIGPDGTATAGGPGPGHTVDNIVAAVRGTDILFGGCLIRPAGSTTLGNTADADIAAWASTVAHVRNHFPAAAVIVPSHGPPGGRDLLALTERLAKEAAAATPPPR